MTEPPAPTFGYPSLRIWRELSDYGNWAIHVEVVNLATNRRHRQTWGVRPEELRASRSSVDYQALHIRADLADKEEVIEYPAWLIHAATKGSISLDRAKRLLMLRADKAIRYHLQEIAK